jgi:cation-transporting ATPase E
VAPTTDPASGLTAAEAARRLGAGQGNTLPRTTKSNVEIVLANFITPFNVILAVLGIILAVLGAPLDALFTTGVMFFNVAIAVFQELRARRKLEQIALLAKPTATVVRDGAEVVIDPAEVVRGDVVVASQGDEIVVDGPVLAGAMDVDESLLTGESDGVHKPLGAMVKSGSAVLSGTGRYLAGDVGADSYAAKLTVRAREFKKRITPIQREVDTTVRVLLLIVAFYVAIFVLGFLLNHTTTLQLARSVAVVFQIAPPGLFLVIVLAYALGAARIAGQGVVVQQVESIETLSRIDVLCLDKTGTLTTNHFELDAVAPLADGVSEADARTALATYAASVSAPNRTIEALTEGLGGRVHAAAPAAPVAPADEVAFSSALKWSALTFAEGPARGAWVLGAPEMVEPGLVAGSVWDPDGSARRWQDAGERVLLLAHSDHVGTLHAGDEPVLPSALRPYALVVLADQLRPDAAATLSGFAETGIQLKVISGDNPDTVAAIATRAGLKGMDDGPLAAVSGAHLDELDDAAFDRVARSANVFGRVTPEQKERLVDSLHRAGLRVAMTGDGVNDVLALKKADVGIAMQSGSIATRNAADIVLLGDRFAAMPGSFKEGQRIVRGVTSMLEVYLTRIVTFIVVLAAVMALVQGFPFLPRQRSLITMVTLTIPNIVLAWWAPAGPVPHGGLMRRIGHFLLAAAPMAIAIQLLMYFGYLFVTRDAALARDVLAILTLTIGLAVIPFVAPPNEFFNVSGQGSWNDWRPTIVTWALGSIITAAVLYTPWLKMLFQFEFRPIPFMDIIWVVAATALWVVAVWWMFKSRFMEKFLRLEE